MLLRILSLLSPITILLAKHINIEPEKSGDKDFDLEKMRRKEIRLFIPFLDFRQQLKMKLYSEAKERKKKNYVEILQDWNKEPYKSFVPGQNIEVLPSTLYRKDYKGYKNLQRAYQLEPNVPYHDNNNIKSKQHLMHVPQGIDETTSPKPIYPSGLKAYLPANPFSFNKKKHLPTVSNFKAPKIHLNVARVYNLAHVPLQAPDEQDNNLHQPFNKIIFAPQKIHQPKTKLYPVQKTYDFSNN